jgi:predicted DNA-binding transcriptional regulator AlpA
MQATETDYGSLKALAVRWGVSVPTARNYTRTPGFPAPLDVGPRSDRWLLEEVLTWEQSRRRERVRRVVTGKRPQHRRTGVRPPARVRTTVSAA